MLTFIFRTSTPPYITFTVFILFRDIFLSSDGHEWLKKQLLQENIAYEELDNGIFSGDSPARLQEIADSVLPTNIQSYFNKWINRIPLPLTEHDRKMDGIYATGSMFILFVHNINITSCLALFI